MEFFNIVFWWSIPVFLVIGLVPAFIGGVISYVINKEIDENKRLESAIKITLVLLPIFSCGICNYWWVR